MELTGKVAVVTGGGRGIGRACALALASAGAHVAVAARSENEVETVARELSERGVRGLALKMDVTDAASVSSAFARLKAELGGCDIIVNNAGIAASSPFQRTTDELLERLMAVNLTGTFRCTRAAIPDMLERKWGRVINIASIAGKAGAPYISAYVASKHAVVGLTKALAQEVAEKGITVNAICPGYVETDMAETAIRTITEKTGMDRAAALKTLEVMTPQKRLFQPEEVAALTVLLASHAGRGINGQAINICGGAVPF